MHDYVTSHLQGLSQILNTKRFHESSYFFILFNPVQLIQQQDVTYTFAVFTNPSAVLQNIWYRMIFIPEAFIQMFYSFDQCKVLKSV